MATIWPEEKSVRFYPQSDSGEEERLLLRAEGPIVVFSRLDTRKGEMVSTEPLNRYYYYTFIVSSAKMYKVNV